MVLLTSATLLDSSAYLSDNVSRGTLHTTVVKIQYCLKFCLNQGTPGTPGLPGKRGRSGQDVGSRLVNLRLKSPHLRRLLQKNLVAKTDRLI